MSTKRPLISPSSDRLSRRVDDASPDDRLTHAEERLPVLEGVRPEAEVEQFRQRDPLRVDVDDGIWVDGQIGGSRRGATAACDHRRRHGGADDLHVGARAPRAAERAYDIRAPVEPPVLVRRTVHHERGAEPDAVLRRERAECEVQRMVSGHRNRAAADLLQAEVAAFIPEPFAFAPELRVKRAFVPGGRGRRLR